jgi:plastocyanin
LLGVGALALATSLSVACGGGDKTPAATTSAATAATKAPGTPTQSTATAVTGQGTTLTLVAKDTLFDQSELKAKPGDVTIVMDNQDPGIPHNLHVFKGTDSKGQDLGKTEIAAGPVKQTLTLNLTAGDYFLVCDVHPATASAKLKVE